MAEIGLIASVITIGLSAAQVSLALFDVVQTLKSAPRQIAEIAEELSLISGILQTLADAIRKNTSFCRPELFKSTWRILSRYNQVKDEIKKLTETSQKLVGLQWYLNKPKAKGLLKKVESIKTLLSLQLSIIHLAREEFKRPFSKTGSSDLVRVLPQPNRFRKLVESAVQANRKVVENAQKDDEDSRAEKQSYPNVGLDTWKEDSYDTATWLYHLVFSPDIPSPSEESVETSSLHQASVCEGSASSDEESTLTRPKADTDEKAMIVWSKQTEPSSVVDRLLSSWTILSPDQITRSAAKQDDDEWREVVLKNIREAKKEDEKTYRQWERENEDVKSCEEDNLSEIATPPYNIHNVDKDRRNRRERSDTWPSKPGESLALDNTRSGRLASDSNTRRRTGGKQRVRWRPEKSSDELSLSRRDDGSTSFSGQTSSTTTIPRPDLSNPSDPNLASSSARFGYHPWQDPFRGTQFPTFDQRPSNPFSFQADPWANRASGFPPHYTSVPSLPSPPPPLAPAPAPAPAPPPPPPVASPPQPDRTEIAAKEEAIMKAVQNLLEKREQNKQLDASEPRFLKLMELFNMQQENELQNERERANAATEAQAKLMQAMHDKAEERLKHLETLLEEQRYEEKNLRRNWQVETEERVQEARATMAKEAAAVQSAMEKAEIQAQQRADARIDTELRKLEHDHRKKLKRYEDQVRELQEQLAKREQDTQLPIRRTHIAEGNRSVEVTEYSTDKRNPFHASASHLRGLQYGFAQLGVNFKQPQAQHQYPRHLRRDSFHSSTTSMQSSYASVGAANTLNTNGSSQQLIVFPAKADRGSTKMAKLQSSLASLGIDVMFEDPEYELRSQLVPYNYGDSVEHLVRSTIIWEAPMLSTGSELLLTMRHAGWRPAYTRISEKGHTHFLGDQPIHAYFFSPDYKPQFSHSTDSSTNEFVLIHKSIVHEDVLIELDFKYQVGDKENYVLDGRVDYRHIEYLVEKSFAINETHCRQTNRKLQGYFNKVADQAPKPTHRSDTQSCEADQPSMPPTPFACSEDNDFKAFEDSNYDTEGGESSAMSTATRRHHRDSDHSDGASTPGRDESSANSGSVVSIHSTSSNNPYRRCMFQAGENKYRVEPGSTSTNIWNDEM